MPHVAVKMFPGRSEEQKKRLAEAITKALMETTDCSLDSVSITVEDVAKADWVEAVWKPEIAGKSSHLYKKPGYDPL